MSWSAADRSVSARRPRVSWRQRDMRLALRLQQPGDGRGAAGPVRGLDLELFSAGASERVEPRAARVLRLAPLGVEPSGALQPLQGGEEGSGVDLEHSARDLFDAAGDAEAVHGLKTEGLEDEHVERALDDVGVELFHDGAR